MKLKKLFSISLVLLTSVLLASCEETSDDIQKQEQEQILREATQQTGMPAITAFSERKQLKRIIELRDKANFRTYTYVMVPGTGERKLLCKSIGYGIPYSTQYTNPQKVDSYAHGIILPQADPNGLFSPQSSDATWVICVNPNGEGTSIVYEENRITVSPFELPR